MGEFARTAALWGVLGVVLAAAWAASTGLIVALRPYLARYALARPNARSSHKLPTPQGGGIAVVTAALAAIWLRAVLSPALGTASGQLAMLTLAAVLLALVGAIDDVRGLGPAPRLLMQLAAVGIVLASLPPDFNIVPQAPLPLERALLPLRGDWFVNLVNFMDGLDWMTVAEVVPVTAGAAVLGFIGAPPPGAQIGRASCR